MPLGGSFAGQNYLTGQAANDYPRLSLGDAFLHSVGFDGIGIRDFFRGSGERRNSGTNAFLHQFIFFHNGDCHAIFVLAKKKFFEG